MRTGATTWTLVCVLAAVSGCAPEPQAPAEPATPPSLDELRGTTYQGLESIGTSITLVDGKWEDAQARASVGLARDYFVIGDLDGAAPDEAVAVLASSTGGSGSFYSLAVVARRDDQVVNIATSAIGDRVQIRDLRVEGRRIVADVLQAGTGDAMCCPGELATRSWELDGSTLRELAPTVQPARLSLDALGSATWVLQSWTFDESAPAQPPVTLQWRDGRFAGSSGCNTYTTAPRALDAPGDIALGPIAGTRKMCPDDAMQVEQRYLGQLGAVTRYGFMLGHLTLTYRLDDGVGTMFFSRQ